MWIFEHQEDQESNIGQLIKSALEIDSGATAEPMLLSLAGSTLSLESCNFTNHETKLAAYKKIMKFRKKLILEIRAFDLGKKNSPLKDIIRALLKLT